MAGYFVILWLSHLSRNFPVIERTSASIAVANLISSTTLPSTISLHRPLPTTISLYRPFNTLLSWSLTPAKQVHPFCPQIPVSYHRRLLLIILVVRNPHWGWRRTDRRTNVYAVKSTDVLKMSDEQTVGRTVGRTVTPFKLVNHRNWRWWRRSSWLIKLSAGVLKNQY